jgi:hypothetical protein
MNSKTDQVSLDFIHAFEKYCLVLNHDLNRLTISELAHLAKVNRISFYKRFINMMDFIKWYLHKDLIFKIKNQSVLTLEIALTLVYEFLNLKRLILRKIMQSNYGIHAEQFIFEEALTYQVMNFSKIDTTNQIPAPTQRVYARFYSAGITHLIVDYINQSELENFDLETYLKLSTRLIKNYIERMIALENPILESSFFKAPQYK